VGRRFRTEWGGVRGDALGGKTSFDAKRGAGYLIGRSNPERAIRKETITQ